MNEPTILVRVLELRRQYGLSRSDAERVMRALPTTQIAHTHYVLREDVDAYLAARRG